MPVNNSIAPSVEYQDIQIIKDWLTTRAPGFIRRLCTGGDTTSIVTKFDSVHNKLDLATLDVTRKIIRGYDGQFKGGKIFDIGKLSIETANFVSEFEFEPLDSQMDAYKAFCFGNNVKVEDLHIIEYIIKDLKLQMEEELDDAVWEGEKDDAAGEDAPLGQRLDGYLTIAKKLVTQGKGTMIATPAVIDEDNCYDATLEVFGTGIGRTLRRRGMVGFCSDNYFENFKKGKQKKFPYSEIAFHQFESTGIECMKITHGNNNSYLMPRIGIQNDNALMISRPEWLAFGFNLTNGRGWKVIDGHYKAEVSNVTPVATQILIQREGALITNSNL